MKWLASAFLLLLSLAAAGQNTVNQNMFGAGFNSLSPTGSPPTPNPWPAQDSNGTLSPLASIRLWDDGVKWSQVETSNGSFTWTKLDYVVNTLVTNGSLPIPMTITYTVGSTPQWAGACSAAADPSVCLPGPVGSGFGGGTQCASPSDYSCLPPSDVNSDGTGTDTFFQTFIGNVMNRYPNKIAYYETGNEWDSGNFWCSTSAVSACGGSTASLKRAVRMAWDAKQLAACISPSSKTISASFHVGTALSWFANYLGTSISAPAGNITIGAHHCTWSAQTVTGAQVFDYPNEHMRGTSTTNPDPTSVIAAWTNAHTALSNAGLSPACIFNDEWGANHGQLPNTATAAAYMGVELALMSTFTGPPICQENYYQWDNADFPPSKSIVGLAHDILAGWLTGATVSNYSLAGQVYSIPLTLSGGGTARIMFDNSKTCSGTTISTCAAGNQSAGSFTFYTDISGVKHSVSGGVAPVGLAPILLTGGGTPQAATPSCLPNGGTFSSNQSVTCTDSSVGAIMCRTFDGSTPATNGTTGCSNGTLTSAAFGLSVNGTLKVIAGGTGFTDSVVFTSSSFTFQGSAPVCSPVGGTYNGLTNVSLTQAQSLAMCDTTNGSSPSSNGAGACSVGSLYSSAIPVSTSQTIKATGIKNGWTDSTITSCAYAITYTLALSISGTGTVSSSPAGISCPGACSVAFSQGSSITLTATAGSSFTFTGWSGACGGTGSCLVSMNSAQNVTATFAQIIPTPSAGRAIGVMLQ